MKNVLRSFTFGIISVFLLTACSDEDENQPVTQRTVVATPEPVPEPEPEPVIEEPVVPEVVAVVEEPVVPEVVPEVVAVVEEPVVPEVTEPTEDSAFAEFRKGIASAITRVGEMQNDGAWKTLRFIDTTSCLSDIEGEYRYCATKTVRAIPGFENALHNDIGWDATSYRDYYEIQ